MKKVIKDHPRSKVWTLEDAPGYLYKWQPKFLTENDLWCLEEMLPFGFVPCAWRSELEVIKMEVIKDEPPTDIELLQRNVGNALDALNACGIRHGDLTRPSVLIRNNKPILIDFGESRLATDPRPDKRSEGDRYWLNRTIKEIIDGSA